MRNLTRVKNSYSTSSPRGMGQGHQSVKSVPALCMEKPSPLAYFCYTLSNYPFLGFVGFAFEVLQEKGHCPASLRFL